MENKPIAVLSLFDGISCGRVALERAGVPVSTYYASEIDKYAISISRKNHPDIVHLGDITQWRTWDIPAPDLILAGSPCQGFSFAGKQLAFEDYRSKLFFDFVEILGFYNPRYFLLENVQMKQIYLNVISSLLGVSPVCINSSLVSAQNRVRNYWCNWDVPGLVDKNIYLRDIVIDNSTQACRMVGRKINNLNNREDKNLNLKLVQCLELRADNKSSCLTTVLKGCLIYTGCDSSPRQKLIRTNYRYPTPIECERLQTLPDNYTAGVSNTQRYKMLGNAWTVDVIAHILKNMK